MQVLRVGVWVCFGLAGVSVAMLLAYQEPVFLAAAISAATVGLLLVGLDRVVALLSDIRTAVRGDVPSAAPETQAAATPDQPVARTLEDLEADLPRIRGKI